MSREKRITARMLRKKQKKKEVVTIDCVQNNGKGLSVNLSIQNVLKTKVFQAVSVGLAAMTMLTSLTACDDVSVKDNNTAETTETTAITTETDKENTVCKSVREQYDKMHSDWLANKRLAEDEVVNAKGLIMATTQEVLDYYDTEDTTDFTLRDDYLQVLNDFKDLCDEILEASANDDTEAMQNIVTQAESLREVVVNNIADIERIGIDEDKGVEEIKFVIPPAVQKDEKLIASCTATELVWGDDIKLEAEDSDILAPVADNPCQLFAVKEGETTVNVMDLKTGEVLYNKVVKVTIEAVGTEAINSDTVTQAPDNDTPAVTTKKSNTGGNNDNTPAETQAPTTTKKPTTTTTVTTTKKPVTTTTATTTKKPVTTTTAATTKAPVVTTTPKVTTTKPTTTTPKVTTTVTTTTTKATEPPQTEPPVVETDWWQYYSDYVGGSCKFGCRNSSEWGYVLKTLDDNFWSAYSDTWDWVDEDLVEVHAEEYFEGDTQFAHTWLTIHGMGGHIVNAAGGVGIEGDLGQSGWGSPYQVLCQNGDCDSHSQFERALWWYLDDGYDTCLVTSDSLNHAWVCVRLPDGRQYDLDGQGIRQGDNIPADAYYHWGEY